MFSVASPGNFNELSFFLASSNMSPSLALRVLDNVKLVSKSLFWKLNWVSPSKSSSTTRPGVEFIIFSINASFSDSATSLAVSKSIWLSLIAIFKKSSFSPS